MTYDNNVFKKFSDIITSYQGSSIGREKFSQASNKNTFRCPTMSETDIFESIYPLCSSHCMNEHDKGIDKKIDHKGSEKNAMLSFSKVFEQ